MINDKFEKVKNHSVHIISYIQFVRERARYGKVEVQNGGGDFNNNNKYVNNNLITNVIIHFIGLIR